MSRTALCLAVAIAVAGCSDDGSEDASSSDNGDGGDGGAAVGTGGSGGAAASTGMTGSGGGAVDRCPEVCAKMETLFASFGCMLEECHCKAPCADLLEASLDCIPRGSPDCSCAGGGNELDCSVCDAETAAANDCWQAN